MCFLFCIFSFSFCKRPFSFFFPLLSPSRSKHLSQISCESISQQMKLFVYLFWSLKLTDEEKKKKENFMYGEGHWGQWTFSLLLVHLWCFAQFIREEGRLKGKGTPSLHVWRVIIFLMTVSSGKMDQMDPKERKKESEKENCGCTEKDLFREMVYVKASDIPEKAPESESP